MLCKAAFLLADKRTRIALRATKKIELEFDSSSVQTGRKCKIMWGNHCPRTTEDSGLLAAQTLSPAKTSQAASEAPDCCQWFSVFLGFKESARALARA